MEENNNNNNNKKKREYVFLIWDLGPTLLTHSPFIFIVCEFEEVAPYALVDRLLIKKVFIDSFIDKIKFLFIGYSTDLYNLKCPKGSYRFTTPCLKPMQNKVGNEKTRKRRKNRNSGTLQGLNVGRTTRYTMQTVGVERNRGAGRV